MLTVPQRCHYGEAKTFIRIGSKLWILVKEIQTGKHPHTHTVLFCIPPVPVFGDPASPLLLQSWKSRFLQRLFSKVRQKPQQVDSRSAQETALGSRVQQQCPEVQHKAFQEHNLPVQQKCKLQLSRTDRFPSSTLRHPVALVKGNSTQSRPDVKSAPTPAGAKNTKDFKHWLTGRNTT